MSGVSANNPDSHAAGVDGSHPDRADERHAAGADERHAAGAGGSHPASADGSHPARAGDSHPDRADERHPARAGGSHPARAGDRYVVGVDFGTLSARALVVRVCDGTPAGTAIHEYAHQVMDSELAATGEALPPDWALQDPQDYRDALAATVPAAIRDAGIEPEQVIGIATDFTASTVLPVLGDGTPLCQLGELTGEKHAYVKLWKHHARS